MCASRARFNISGWWANYKRSQNSPQKVDAFSLVAHIFNKIM